MSTIVDTHRPQFDEALDHLKKELRNLRTGRARASLVEEIPVDVYGSRMDMKSVASISTPDAKTIQIEPWDKNVAKDIEKALIAANLGMAPNVAGAVIRLVMPSMTEENRKAFAKQVRERAEEARIRVRNVREEIREKIHAQEQDKTIGEDEKFRLQEQLDKVAADMNAQIEKVAGEKEQEVMTI